MLAVFNGPGGKELLNALLLTAYLLAAGYLALLATAYHLYRKRRAAEQRIRHLAHYDALTDLPNHALLAERTAQALVRAGGRGVALLLVDLDRFKQVNDSLGHAAGDEVLRRSARRLEDALHGAGLVARQGGDEFTVLLPSVADRDAAARAALGLVAAMREPVVLGEREVPVSSSIGVALAPESGADFETLLRNADTAMYAAKEAGRDGVRVHAPEMTRRVTERMELEAALRQALRGGRLHLALQAQVELSSGALSGMEALARWTDGGRGAVSPAQFIPVAEDSGLIGPLGEWMLRETCRLRAEWLRSGLAGVPAAVNVSALQFRDPGFAARVKRALADFALPPDLLELEVTESVLMAGFEQVRRTLEEVGGLGVRVSIDDFGTGYSSLSYLKRLPVDKLKIDRSFVTALPADA